MHAQFTTPEKKLSGIRVNEMNPIIMCIIQEGVFSANLEKCAGVDGRFSSASHQVSDLHEAP